jgi:tetratricopeptide (TPR) repeat protein
MDCSSGWRPTRPLGRQPDGSAVHGSGRKARAPAQRAVGRIPGENTSQGPCVRPGGARAGYPPPRLPGIAAALNNLGEYHLNNGNHDKALECFGQALSLGKAIDNKPIVAVSTAHIGVVHYFRGQYDTSLRFAQEALPLLRELNLRKEWAENLSIISYLYNAKGNTQKALDYSLQALRLRQQCATTPKSPSRSTPSGIFT